MIDKRLRLMTDLHLKFLGSICLAILIIILIVGLWPFNFFPKNKVTWLPDKNGVCFPGQSMILSLDPLNDPQQSLLNKKTITIEILIRPTEEPQGDINRILSMYDEKSSEITFLSQWKKHLIIRSRTKRTDANRWYREIGIDDAFRKEQDYLLSVVSGKEGTTLYINGQPVKTYPRHHLLDSITSKKVSFILGNSPVGKHSWKGRVMELAIYNRSFTPEEIFEHYQSYLENNFTMSSKKEEGHIGLYLFNEKLGATVHDYSNLNNHLTIPAIFRPVQRIILALPGQDFRWDKSFVQDTIVNLLGFVPVGFFFTAFLLKAGNWKRRTIYIVVAAAGFVISLAIELLQIYLPSRNSQLNDVICNAVGTVLGILILHLLMQNKKIHL